MRGERSHHAQNAQGPAWAGCTHLAAGASSPSQFGPSPHPQGPSCHQSSCRLRACKRLQQMWGGGRGGIPRESSSQDRAQLCSSHIPTCPIKALALARTPDSQATDSQTNPLPNQGGACSVSAPAPFCPPITTGGQDHAQLPSPGLLGPSYSRMTEQPPPAKAAEVAAKKLRLT